MGMHNDKALSREISLKAGFNLSNENAFMQNP